MQSPLPPTPNADPSANAPPEQERCFRSKRLGFDHRLCYSEQVRIEGNLDTKDVAAVNDSGGFDARTCVRLNDVAYVCSEFGDQRAIAAVALAQMPKPTLPLTMVAAPSP